MSSKNSQEVLFQLKIDYLQFMIQVQDWHDPNIMIIIYALLMERKKVTQSQLIDLTGLNRSTISETLSLLINDPRGIPVLQTRMKGDKKKYYYCPLSFKDYIKRMFGGALTVVKLNLSFIPKLVSEINHASNISEEVEHTKNFLIFFYTYNNLVEAVMEDYEEIIDKYFENDPENIHFDDLIHEDKVKVDYSKEFFNMNAVDRPFSLDLVKRDFMNEIPFY